MSTTPKDGLLKALNATLIANHASGVGCAIVVVDAEGARTIIGKRGDVPNELMDSALVCLQGSWWSVAYESKESHHVVEDDLTDDSAKH